MTQLHRSCDLLAYPDFATILKNIYLAALGLSCGMQAYLLQGMWNLGSLTRDQTYIPCIERWILNHWTTREVPQNLKYIDNHKEITKNSTTQRHLYN